ncbi:MerR family transcriptional regulator [Paenibacillus polymyxa]|uniref:MerR family transcriptional regulator n=1 Tax=Paenibacillus polymyxa TaxID=1406 RepID=UPI000F8987AD|nr:MerR family transcriptional regulator [Paenibacillus polymyxa]QDA26287.1 MerR family transcriptional regulator [Paenibacillus polymyxa]RTZ31196.1 MerR family transcriptional regulator [Paenibacillus polymyxa]
MAYTVKEVSNLSGISVRTLHYYDEIGLLKPHHTGNNGYRYYEQEQLLRLQQIMVYRELDLPLSEIGNVLEQTKEQKAEVLQVHRANIEAKVFRLHTLLQTIDETVAHLKGEQTMEPGQMYQGFNPEKQEMYERDLTERYGSQVEEKVQESKTATTNWSKEDYLDSQAEADQIHRELAEAMNKGLKHNSAEVQALIRRHLQWVSRFYTPTAEIYSGLGDLYVEHEDFSKMYEGYHSGLAEYLRDGMKELAKRELT